jgi:hypothetical protein
MPMMRRPRRWWPLYVSWIAFCAFLFLALSNAEDPSRPQGRILSVDAGIRARAIAAERGYAGYEVVHVARARAGEGAAVSRWVVLLDRTPRTALREAIVVELDETTGALLTIRRPAGVPRFKSSSLQVFKSSSGRGWPGDTRVELEDLTTRRLDDSTT